MTYLPGIPQSGDIPTQSQSQILNNFTALNTVFAVDHLAFNAVNGGRHQQTSLVNSAIAPVTVAGEGAIYTRNPGAAREQLYYRRESAGIEIPITPLIGGYGRVAAAILIGDSFNINPVIGNPAAGTYTITFTNNMTSTNYGVLVTIVGDVGINWTGTFALGSFQIFTGNAAGALVNRNFSFFITGEIA